MEKNVRRQPLHQFLIALLLLGYRYRCHAFLLVAPSSSNRRLNQQHHRHRHTSHDVSNNQCRQHQRRYHRNFSNIGNLVPLNINNQSRSSLAVLLCTNIDTTNSNDDDGTKKMSQMELLLELENKFDYQGRISSKMTGANENDGNEEEEAEATMDIEHRCALITILGMPNMGKSTLLNALLSESLAIVTSRPQTTRHAILGVLTTPYTQLCVTDTPGIIGLPAYKLQQGMMDVVKGAVRDADLFLVVTDVYSGSSSSGGGSSSSSDTNTDDDDNKKMDVDDGNGLGIGEEMLSKLRTYGKPVIVCVNKVDLASEKDGDRDNNNNNTVNDDTNTPSRAIQTIQTWRSVLPNAFAILPTCAANGPSDPGVNALRSILLANDPSIDVGSAIRNLGRPVPGMFPSTSTGAMLSNEQARDIIPLGPPLYHPDFFTDRTDRFCASELIRETLFQSLGKELPYCCEVRVETFDESRRYVDEEEEGDDVKSSSKKNAMIRIGATILVERDSQKGIVVGKGGAKIKDVGVIARKKLEEFYDVKVFLDLRVKVDKNWRNDAEKLKKYGYM